jgi:hypothetical protein
MLVSLSCSADRPLPLPVVVVEGTAQPVNAAVLSPSSSKRSSIVCRLYLIQHLLRWLLLLLPHCGRAKFIWICHHSRLGRVLIPSVCSSGHAPRTNAGPPVSPSRSAPRQLSGGHSVGGVGLLLSLSRLCVLLAIIVKVIKKEGCFFAFHLFS